MDERELFNYIQKHYNLDGTSSRLVNNIIQYVESQGFVDAEDAHAHLSSLLRGAFGIMKREVQLYRAPCCCVCGEYVTGRNAEDADDTLSCKDCQRAERREKNDKGGNRL